MARKSAQARRKPQAQRPIQSARNGTARPKTATRAETAAREHLPASATAPMTAKPASTGPTAPAVDSQRAPSTERPAPLTGAASPTPQGTATPSNSVVKADGSKASSIANGTRANGTKANGTRSAPVSGAAPAIRPANGKPASAMTSIPPSKLRRADGVGPDGEPRVDENTQRTGTASHAARAAAVLSAPPEVVPAPPVEAPMGEPPASLAELLGTRLRLWFQPRMWSEQVWTGVRGLSLESWAWIAILLLAAVLRYWGLGDKPLHHDESMHAYFSLQFARDPASYWYDPLLHGPFQFHAEGIVFAVILALSNLFHVATAAGNPWINDTTARLLPATTGLFLVGITYGLRRELGRVGALAAAFCLAISPAFVYFSRFLREDIYFACFTYATIVCAIQWARKRNTGWLIATVLAFVLAYATKESIYLNMVIWGSLLVILAVWEIGHIVSDKLPRVFSDRERAFFGHAAPLLLLGAVASAFGAWALHQIDQLSVHVYTVQLDPNSTAAAQMNQQVTNLENTTVAILLYASIALALLVIVVLAVQLRRDLTPVYEPTSLDPMRADVSDLDGTNERPVLFAGSIVAGLRARLDPERHRFLRLLLDTTWVNWFVAFVAGWVLFVALYWIVPPGPNAAAPTFAQGFQVGVGRGIWQGLYYWLQQQQVARGGQPWYYYLILIPMYEQLAVVIGAAGIIRCLARPTRFRLFLVYWFVASLALYSWAGEKMPWLSIHILLPLMLLSGVALDWILRTVAAGVRALAQSDSQLLRAMRPRLASAVLGLTVALVLLIPTTYGMFTLSHRDAANGPHEMMVYVQTTPDVQTLMDKITHADALMYGGKHQLKIAVGVEEEWPFYWYLRDYWLDPHPSQYVYFDYPVANSSAPQEDILILTPGDAATFMAAHPKGYTEHTYSLRSWWDEGYKPAPCISTPKHTCTAAENQNTGVGLGNWLTYGDNVPANGHFQLSAAASHLWAWLWQRRPIGSDQGSFDFVLVVRDGVPMRA